MYQDITNRQLKTHICHSFQNVQAVEGMIIALDYQSVYHVLTEDPFTKVHKAIELLHHRMLRNVQIVIQLILMSKDFA